MKSRLKGPGPGRFGRTIHRYLYVVVTCTALAGLSLGFWIYQVRTGRPRVHTLPELVRELQKRDGTLYYARVRLWLLLPKTLTSRFPGLQPHSAADYRRSAAEELSQWGARAQAAVPYLAAAVQDPDYQVRLAVLQTLGILGPAAKAATPSVLAFFNRLAGFNELIEAASTLVAVAPDDPEVLQCLLNVVRSHMGQGQEARILEELGTLRPPPAGLSAALHEFLQDTNGSVRTAAVRVLGGMASATPDLIWSLIELFESLEGQSAVPNPAAGRIEGQAAPEAEPSWAIQAFRAERDATESCIVEALGRLGPSAQEAKPFLARIVTDRTDLLRYAAARALWLIEHKPDAVLQIYADGLCHGFDAAKTLILDDLPDLGPESVPVVMIALEDSNVGIRYAAIKSLMRLGAAARPAVPRLQSLQTNDPKYAIRTAAARAVKNLQSE
jgi:HEAT repeat protein